MPFTNWVLPEPRSPVSPMISPASAWRPHASPSASVSAGLCEMNVAIGREGPHPAVVPDRYAFPGGNLSDASERQLRKLRFPGIEERHRFLAGDREEQFKILAVGQSGQKGRLGGWLFFGRQPGFPAHRDGC